jgi:hypothetical protein
MKLKEAIELIVNEAEVSALGNKDDTQLDVLKAIEVFKYFYDKYGYHFDNLEHIDADILSAPETPPESFEEINDTD